MAAEERDRLSGDYTGRNAFLELGSPGGETVAFRVMGNDLQVLHEGYEYYCCLQASLRAEIEGTDIYLHETNQNGECRCMCTYDLEYMVYGLPDGRFTAHLINHRGEEIAAQELAFPSEVPSTRLLLVAGCEGSVEETDAGEEEAVELAAEPGTLRVLHRGLVHQCCALFAVACTVGEGSIVVREHDESPLPCPCLCAHDLEVVILGIPPGVYRFALYAPGGWLRAEEMVRIEGPPPEPFVRGEANGDGAVDLADAVWLLRYLFASGATAACEDAGDVNDDGRLNIADPVALLRYLFAGGDRPPPPFPLLGSDPTPDGLTCSARAALADIRQ